jgi:glycosyltransferase involved in cell wall biosynthesis
VTVKLLHLSPFYPPHIGGLESHARGFDRHLSNPTITITTLVPRLPRTAPAQEQHGAITIYRYPAWEVIPNYPIPALWHPGFWRQLRRARPRQQDIIISRTRFFFSSLLAALLSKTTAKTHLHIEHGSDFVSLNNPLMQRLARLYDLTLGRFVLWSADTIVANSHASADFVKKLSGRQALVIYRGVDKAVIAKTKPADLTKYKQHPNDLMIVFAGRLIDGKGVDDLLHALRLLMTNDKLSANTADPPNWRASYKLLIIGTGPQEQPLKKLAAGLGVADHVSFLGPQNFRRTIALIKASDIFVNPSHTEGLPTSVIEAALCRTAIIATAVGGTPEVITAGLSGRLIAPKKPAILAQNIQQLAASAALRQSPAASAEREVAQKFSWQTTTRAYQELFASMLNRPPQ